MLSHTVPKKLLEQFAYYNPHKRSLWLWRYEKGRQPYPHASPKSATRIDGHFATAEDPAKEAELERRLNAEIEEPVTKFLSEIGKPDYIASQVHRRQLTLYVSLLFLRSEARRKAAAHTQEIFKKTVETFIRNEDQIRTVAAKWSIDLLLARKIRSGLVTTKMVADGLRKQIDSLGPTKARNSYVRMVERAILEIDVPMMNGEWRYLRTSPDNPFVLSDAPVVTWERHDKALSYGLGFHRSDIEVLLPVSPLLCLHILPAVTRTRPVVDPSVAEVNTAQAAFATRHCFSNVNSPVIDALLQPSFGNAEIGVRSFTIWHRNFEQSLYSTLMGAPVPFGESDINPIDGSAIFENPLGQLRPSAVFQAGNSLIKNPAYIR